MTMSSTGAAEAEATTGGAATEEVDDEAEVRRDLSTKKEMHFTNVGGISGPLGQI